MGAVKLLIFKGERMMNLKIAVAFFALVALIASGRAEIAASVDSPDGLENIPASAEETYPLSVGTAVPSVTLQTVDEKHFDLKPAVEKQAAVLIFYRGGW
jgi:hypothetical protein